MPRCCPRASACRRTTFAPWSWPVCVCVCARARACILYIHLYIYIHSLLDLGTFSYLRRCLTRGFFFSLLRCGTSPRFLVIWYLYAHISAIYIYNIVVIWYPALRLAPSSSLSRGLSSNINVFLNIHLILH